MACLPIRSTQIEKHQTYDREIDSGLCVSSGWCALSHIHGRPCLPSAQFDSGKEVEIAAIHPDFCAAEPLSLMEFAGRVLISLTSFSLPV